MSHQGFDSLTVDMQHGVVDYQVAVTMLQGIAARDVVPLARVPWNDPAWIMKILDAGAYGVICPMINTRQDAEAIVGACQYAPRAVRSFEACKKHGVIAGIHNATAAYARKMVEIGYRDAGQRQPLPRHESGRGGQRRAQERCEGGNAPGLLSRSPSFADRTRHRAPDGCVL